MPGNSTALVTSEGVVLVDDKFEQDAPNILALLKTVTNQPVRYVVNTHYHADHSGGNARLQMAGAQVIASEQSHRYMVDAKQPGQPTVTFADRASIHLGGKDVELYYFGRAHTGGDIFVYFPADRALAAGDAPPSNWMILASMQCLANRPSALATNGVVWTTFGGVTETPTLILRMPSLQSAAAAGETAAMHAAITATCTMLKR